MHIDVIVVGFNEVNCYIVSDEKTKDAFIIDPGFESQRIKKFIDDKGLEIKYIINTHGHADHIGCNSDFPVPIYIHEADAEFLTDPVKNLSTLFGKNITSPPAERLLKGGDSVFLNDLKIDIIHTPGHTPGGICLKIDSTVFTGDTLFRGSIGRTDFPYGDSRKILEAIKQYLLPMDDSTKLYPGHGPSSVLGWERANNFYLSRL